MDLKRHDRSNLEKIRGLENNKEKITDENNRLKRLLEDLKHKYKHLEECHNCLQRDNEDLMREVTCYKKDVDELNKKLRDVNRHCEQE